MRRHHRFVTLVVAGLLGAGTAAPAGAQPCQFVLGFATLHNLIPGIVGQCAENAQHDPTTGDATQRTTNGLLVWRKADNFTAFTDGARTWVNGPLGVQERLNGQRLWWETNPERLPIVPTPTPGERCHTAGLTLSTGQGSAGVGHEGVVVRLANNLDVACTFYGYPGAGLLDAQGDPLPSNVIRGGGYLFRDPGPALVTVPPGGSASFGLEWVHIPVGNETTCPTASQLQVTPPDEYVPLTAPARIMACDGGTLHVTAMQAA